MLLQHFIQEEIRIGDLGGGRDGDWLSERTRDYYLRS